MAVYDEIAIDPNYNEETNNDSETSRNGLINHNYVAQWNNSPFPPSFFPPINHQVSLIKIDPDRL